MPSTNRRGRSPLPPPQWNTGDIAFLKPSDMFSCEERAELIDTRRLPLKALTHPVIILDKSSDSKDYMVTTVSAYSSGPDNNFLAPWKQIHHRRKDANSFRAFEGSEKPKGNNFQYLNLADSKQWPKRKTSWVNAQSVYLVPASVLVRYDKSPCQLRMDPASLQDLLSHMGSASRKFQDLKEKLSKGKADDNGQCQPEPPTRKPEQSRPGNPKRNRQAKKKAVQLKCPENTSCMTAAPVARKSLWPTIAAY
ncbi:hypothetical protein GGR50DRAFT_235860 [Xylaria sp. CBS 124048]|nr:hypothetical protein GGR50DRAFT_235860 [Xylaria sp. CBS 124048]